MKVGKAKDGAVTLEPTTERPQEAGLDRPSVETVLQVVNSVEEHFAHRGQGVERFTDMGAFGSLVGIGALTAFDVLGGTAPTGAISGLSAVLFTGVGVKGVKAALSSMTKVGTQADAKKLAERFRNASPFEQAVMVEAVRQVEATRGFSQKVKATLELEIEQPAQELDDRLRAKAALLVLAARPMPDPFDLEQVQTLRATLGRLAPEDVHAFRNHFLQAFFDGFRPRGPMSPDVAYELYHALVPGEIASERLDLLLGEVSWDLMKRSSDGKALSLEEVKRLASNLQKLPYAEQPPARAALRVALLDGWTPKVETDIASYVALYEALT